MQTVDADLKFKCPFGCMVVGPSMSGKSHFVLQLLRNVDKFFDPPPRRIIYAYGILQSAFDKMDTVQFVKGVEGLASVTFSAKTPGRIM